MDQEKIGSFIAENRKAKGFTQIEFAEKLGVSNKSVSRWETGKNSTCTVENWFLTEPIIPRIFRYK